MLRATARAEQELGHSPSDAELAESSGIPIEEIQLVMQQRAHAVSLDMPKNQENSEESLVESCAHPDALREMEHFADQQSMSVEINRLLNILPSREHSILCAIFGVGQEPVSLEDLARKHDITVERVRQVKEMALKRIRRSKGVKNLQSFL